jgi:hypothetical protein
MSETIKVELRTFFLNGMNNSIIETKTKAAKNVLKKNNEKQITKAKTINHKFHLL